MHSTLNDTPMIKYELSEEEMEKVCKIIACEVDFNPHINKLLSECIFFDIETTGLGHYNKIIIIGITKLKNLNEIEIIQFFDETGNCEKELLDHFIEYIKSFSRLRLISFNGDAFDIPFVNARLRHHKINFQIDKSINVDLLKIARKYKHIFQSDKLNLKTLEKHYGIDREDLISGAESIILYNTYLRDKTESLKLKILQHNFDDLKNMVPLIKIMDNLNENDWGIYQLEAISFRCLNWTIVKVEIKFDQCFVNLVSHNKDNLLPVHHLAPGLSIHIEGQVIQLKMDLITLKNNRHTIKILNFQKIENVEFAPNNNDYLNNYVFSIDDNIVYNTIYKFVDLYLKALQ